MRNRPASGFARNPPDRFTTLAEKSTGCPKAGRELDASRIARAALTTALAEVAGWRLASGAMAVSAAPPVGAGAPNDKAGTVACAGPAGTASRLGSAETGGTAGGSMPAT